MIHSVDVASLPVLTAEQMREVDRVMIEDLRIELIQMMENAGRNLAQLALELWTPGHLVVLAGPGGNGGGGLVAARHLANRGVRVTVSLAAAPGRLAPVPAHQLDILHRMRVPVASEPPEADLVLDAVLGYSLHGDPTGRAAELIVWANGMGAPVLALDTPSGLDVTTGATATPCVRATATLTLAAPKRGLLRAPEVVGDLYLGDISVPPTVYRDLGLPEPSAFAEGPIVRVAGSRLHRP
jgi:NAD(P)H-hydrate epimerase